MKTIIFFLAFILLVGSCKKSENLIPSDAELFDATFTFSNTGFEVLPLVELQSVIFYIDKSETSSTLSNKLNVGLNTAITFVANGDLPFHQVSEGCEMWSIVHVTQALGEENYYETIWLTDKRIVSDDENTHSIHFSWPADTLAAVNVGRFVKEDIFRMNKQYPIHY
jgi:hypothetical protein